MLPELCCSSRFSPQCVFSIKPLTPADSPWISGRVAGQTLVAAQLNVSYQHPGIQLLLLYSHLLCCKSIDFIASGCCPGGQTPTKTWAKSKGVLLGMMNVSAPSLAAVMIVKMR